MDVMQRSSALRSSFRALGGLVPRGIAHEGVVLEQHIREGRFQRSLALVTALSAILSGLEVTYEHYRGSYSRRVMYTPVALSAALTGVAVWTVFSRRAARVVLPIVSTLTVVDGMVGFYFHVRGVARKPGGWRIPVMNVIMGPPVFAPLLFALSGYLGLITTFLRREDDPAGPSHLSLPYAPRGIATMLPRGLDREGLVLEQHIREGMFQKHLAVVAGVSGLLSGLEALYSHYENGFQYRKSQWSPLVLTPVLLAAGIGTVWSRGIARTLLPFTSALALLDGALGFYFHARGVLRRPGGLKLPLYNVIYGPPVFAPLLFAASGFMGVLASLLRRADR
jgi:hypothetical protein